MPTYIAWGDDYKFVVRDRWEGVWVERYKAGRVVLNAKEGWHYLEYSDKPDLKAKFAYMPEAVTFIRDDMGVRISRWESVREEDDGGR